MDIALLIEHGLNGLQFGLMLFLLAAGLTLVLGIMDLVNLAHGSLYMAGAYFAASFTGLTGSYWLGLLLACLLYTSPSPRDQRGSRMPSSA